jgi:tetratricopeptide (TPR) repeat protein/tRNA A-37 threonylcarbamoyl transferase component Bud32
MITRCSVRLLEQLLEGELDETAVIPLRAHLADCDSCQSWLDANSEVPTLRSCISGLRRAKVALEEPGLRRMLSGLREDPASPSVNRGRRDQVASLPVMLLEPPQARGELGRLGPYRVEQELGRGGMGIVFRAVDVALGRTVALKVLRPDVVSPEAQSRLLREARLAARLRDEHVVLVHAVEQLPDGLPYLVLEYVHGQPLSALLREQQRLEPSEAVAVVVQAADGLAAAHAAGLAHRDVKPGNILVETATGQVKVTDFGLARAEALAQSLTPDGAVLGTPVYMSPEQAQGAATDARTDVYSLGVTLYESLTGEVPFRGTTHRVLQQVVQDEPPPARRLHDGLPRDLETICQKAMAKEPRRRYPTAAELAADLRRWQRGEPILARPAGRLERGWRWCRRNPRVAALAAALVLVFLAGFAGVTWQWRRASSALAVARRHFLAAQGAVDDYLTAVSDDPELKARNLEPLRRKLLGRARDYYEGFIREHPDDPALLAELGMAHGRLGVITVVLDSPPQSIEHFERKRAIFERLCREQPQVTQYRHELADSYWQLGYGLHHTMQMQPAWDAFSEARRLWQELTDDYPDEPEYAARLIRTLNSLGRSYAIGGRSREAEKTLQEGRAAYLRWVHGHAAESRHHESMAWLLSNLGSVYRRSGRLEAARAPLEEAAALGEALTAANPKEAGYTALLQHALTELGWAAYQEGQAARAETAWQKALRVNEALAREHSDTLDYQSNVADSLLCLGSLLCNQGTLPGDARQVLERALAINEKVMTECPSCWPYAMGFCGSAQVLSQLLRQSGELEVALKVNKRALERWTSIFPPGKVDEAHEIFRGRLHADRGLTLRALGQYAAARAEFELARNLDRPPYREEFRRIRDLMAGHVLAQQGEHARAAAIAREHAEQPGLPASADDGEIWTRGNRLYLAAGLLSRCAAAAHGDQRLAQAGRERQTDQYAAEAVAFLRQASAAGHFHLQSIRTCLSIEVEFEPLRSRSDFQSILTEAQKPPITRGP